VKAFNAIESNLPHRWTGWEKGNWVVQKEGWRAMCGDLS